MMPEVGAIAAALMGALAYGAGDFVGSRAALRISTFGAVAVAQTVAMALMVQYVVANAAPLPGGAALGASIVAGLAYSGGVMLLFHGLAHGRIGVVAPLCGLFSILVPLAGDVFLERTATNWHIVGIGFCALAVVLIAGTTADGQTKPIGMSIRIGIVSGIGYGVADLCLGLVPPDVSTGSLMVTRSVAATVAAGLLICYVLHRRLARASSGNGVAQASAEGRSASLALSGTSPLQPSMLHLGLLLAIVAGAFDTLGHAGYVTSAAQGSMGVAASLVALFPAVSVVLAVVFLKERVSSNQLAGFAASIVGVMLVTA
jgi:drug/metabolite transporter (DMT)-like permease